MKIQIMKNNLKKVFYNYLELISKNDTEPSEAEN
jgi:hypothetical protein